MNRRSPAGADGPDRFYAALLEDDARELYEHAPCGYLSTAPDGTIVRANQTFLAWTGYSSDDLIGRRSFADLLTPGGKIFHETHYAPMLRMQGMAREIALELVCATGRRLSVLVNAILRTDDTGEPLVIRVAVFDATERRDYERELLNLKRKAEESEARAKALVATLQQVLLPPLSPMIPGLEVAAEYRAARKGLDVGGDFYDVFQLDEQHWGVVIGDVCGKGAEAAVVTSVARHTVRAAAVKETRPRDVLATLNEVLVQDEIDRFCTVCYIRLRRVTDGWEAVFCVAGHPLPVLLTPGRSPAEIGKIGSLLGVFPEPALHDSSVVLQPRDALVFYTDGLTEGRRADELFGLDNVIASLGRDAHSVHAAVSGVVSDALAFQDGVPRDDIAVVGLGVPGR